VHLDIPPGTAKILIVTYLFFQAFGTTGCKMSIAFAIRFSADYDVDVVE